MGGRAKAGAALSKSLGGNAVSLRPKELDDRRNWTIVGVFTDNDSARESEIWTDIDDLKVDAQNHTADTNSLHVLLKPGTEATFKHALENQLSLDVESEAEYYSKQASLASQLRSLGLVIAITLAVGATFGGMNTMYTAVGRREMRSVCFAVWGSSDAT